MWHQGMFSILADKTYKPSKNSCRFKNSIDIQVWISFWSVMHISRSVRRWSCGFLKAFAKIMQCSEQLNQLFPNTCDSLSKAAMTAECGRPNALPCRVCATLQPSLGASLCWGVACRHILEDELWNHPTVITGQAALTWWNLKMLMYVTQSENIMPTQWHFCGFIFTVTLKDLRFVFKATWVLC